MKKAMAERDDLLKIAEKKTPGNVWSKDILLPRGSDSDVGPAETTLSQKLSKIKVLVKSVLPHRQLFVPNEWKSFRWRAKQVKVEGGSTLPNVTDQNAAPVFPKAVIKEEIKNFDAIIEETKDKLKLILFVEMAVMKPHILRDCIVACFPVKDEGNYYAHPSFLLDSVLGKHLRASMYELDPNDINTSLYECETYINRKLSEDCTKLEQSMEHNKDLEIPTTDGNVNEKGKGKQVHY
ncbi:hypothetical protein ACEPAI_2687 [Sanghuangporus weigelae]